MSRDAIQLSPSILASDFLRLGEQVREVEDAGVTRLQIDVMDGHFVPNITVGTAIVAAVRSMTGMVLEAHLMITAPERYLNDFAEAGADLLIVHQEVSPHLYRTLEHIKDLGKRAGVAINPATPPAVLDEVYGLADLILVMTVSPGFGGQEFIARMIPKIKHVRAAIDRSAPGTELEVDGGIDGETAPPAVAAGARVLVAGTSIYRAPEGVRAAVKNLTAAAQRGLAAVQNVR